MFSKMKNMISFTSTTVQNEPEEQPASTSKPKKDFKPFNMKTIVVGRLDTEEAFLFLKNFLGEISDDKSEALYNKFKDESINGQTLVYASKDEDNLNGLKEVLLPLVKCENVMKMINFIKVRETELQKNASKDSSKIITRKRKNNYNDTQSKTGKGNSNKDATPIIRKKRKIYEDDDDNSDTDDDQSKTEDSRSSTSISETKGSKLTISEQAKTTFKEIEVIKDNDRPETTIGVEAEIKGSAQTTFETIRVASTARARQRSKRRAD